MKIEITSVSTSKKGTVWLQAKLIDMPFEKGKKGTIEVGDVLECELLDVTPKEVINTDTPELPVLD